MRRLSYVHDGGGRRPGTGTWRQVTSELADEPTWEPAAVGDSEGVRGVQHSTCLLAAPPAGGCLRVQRCLRVRARGACVSKRSAQLLLLLLRVRQVKAWVRACGLAVRGTAATTHGAAGLVPSRSHGRPFPTRPSSSCVRADALRTRIAW